jgi:hypothetical protein
MTILRLIGRHFAVRRGLPGRKRMSMVRGEDDRVTKNGRLRGGPAAASIVAMYRPAGRRIKTTGLAQSTLAGSEPSARVTVTTPLPSMRETSPLIRKRTVCLRPRPNVAGKVQEAIVGR